MRSARAARPWAPAWWCRSRNRRQRTDDGREPHRNSAQSRPRFRGGELQRESRWPWVPAFAGTNGSWYCMIALSPASVFRLAMVLPFMHLQPCGGPRGRRKRFRRSVAQWLEHRSPNSALAIPPNSIACHLVNVFGLKMPSRSRRRISLSYPVPTYWVAKW